MPPNAVTRASTHYSMTAPFYTTPPFDTPDEFHQARDTSQPARQNAQSLTVFNYAISH